MILVGNARGGAKNLAQHLTKDENDHVTVHELRGFASDNLNGALNEAYAVSRGTKCKQFLFSLSLNPPPDAEVTTDSFEKAIDRIKTQLGLAGQPRAIVFHEKEGRRHAHAVWSRIDAQTMTARQLSFHKNKLQDVSRELYHEHGWRMPDGFADRSKSDPRNFTLAQWQQAKRHDKDPQEIKDAFRDSWAISDNKVAFEHALKERGYWLARGDKRGFTAIDNKGEVYSIPRQAGVKTKAVRERLGDEADLPSIEQAKSDMAEHMLSMLSRLYQEQVKQSDTIRERFAQDKQMLLDKQRLERQHFENQQHQRRIREQADRQARFRSGIKGVWDRLRGEHARLTERNRQETLAAQLRDRAEQDAIILAHLKQRRAIKEQTVERIEKIKKPVQEIKNDKVRFEEMRRDDQSPLRSKAIPKVKEDFKTADKQRFLEKRQRQATRHSQKRSFDLGREP